MPCHPAVARLIGYTVGAVALLHATGCSPPGWLGPAVEVAGAAAAAHPDSNPPVRHRVDPQLRVSDSQLDFGTIGIAARALRQLEVRNISRFDLTLVTARSSGACFALVTTSPFPITLASNAATTLTVGMSSQAATGCDGRLEIKTDSAAAGLVTFRLKGRVAR
jgi:hypothetical protein